MTASPSRTDPQLSPWFGKMVTGGAQQFRAGILLVGVLASLWFVPRARADWSFAILGDTRGAHDTTTGISSNLNTIAAKIAEMKPDLVLVGGDLCNGNSTNGLAPLTYAQQFVNWKTAMNLVIASNIPIYTVRGNHENNCDEGPPITELKQDYFNAFGAFMPTNGPNHGATNDQRGFTYSFAHNNATFIVLDQYFYYDQTAKSGYHTIDQAWLNQQFQQANTPYTIVMAHEPVFMTTGESGEEHFFGNNPSGDVARAEFWNSLGASGVRLYTCGHVHNLSVGLINDDNGNKIYQLTSGNGGAPVETIKTNHDAGVAVLFTNDTNFGFALATVGANSMTIDYYLLNSVSNTWLKAAYATTVLVGSAGAGATLGDWRILDHPNSVATFPRAVSGKKVVGIYSPTPSESHGFVYDGTTWANLDYPGALYTEVLGISGQKIVGSYYTDPTAQVWHGFVYDGRTWKTLDCPGAEATHAYGIQGNTIVGYYFDGRADQGFSYDGKTWTTLNKPQAAETFVNGIAGKTMVGNYVANDLFHGYAYDGKNWTSLDMPGAQETRCWGGAKTQAVGSFWIGPPGEHGFLYDLTDATWTPLDFPGADATQAFGVDGQNVVGDFTVAGQTNVTHGFIYAITPDRTGASAHAEGWVVGNSSSAGYGVILHTTNGGQQWDRQGSKAEIPNVPLNNVKAVNRRTVWAVGASESGYGVILRTADGGQTWVRQGQSGTIPDVVLNGIAAANRKTAWVVGSRGTILRTDDAGQTWTQQTSGTTVTLFEVAAVNSKIAWATGDNDSGYPVILHTTNGGRTWERQGTAATLGGEPNAVVVSAVNARTAWVVGQHGLVANTTDGGASWHVQVPPSGGPDNNAVCGINPNTAWIATDYNTVNRTANGGTTWNRQSLTGQVLGNYYLLGVSAQGRDTAWVVGTNIPDPIPTKGIILHTTDGGMTWHIQTPPVNVPFGRGVSFVGSRK